MTSTQLCDTRPSPDTHVSATSMSRKLTQRIMDGDRSAEFEAWTRYNPDMMKTARTFTNNPYDAEDRINTAWVIALPKLRAGELINRDALRAFLRGIVRTVSLSELRRCSWLSTCDDIEFLEQSIVDSLTPCDDVLNNAAVLATIDLINSLPVERDREILFEEFFENASRESLCEKYKVTQLQFSRWLSRARKRLRERVRDWDELGLAEH